MEISLTGDFIPALFGEYVVGMRWWNFICLTIKLEVLALLDRKNMMGVDCDASKASVGHLLENLNSWMESLKGNHNDGMHTNQQMVEVGKKDTET